MKTFTPTLDPAVLERHPRARLPLGRSVAPVLRGAGQAAQLPGGRRPPLLRPARPLPLAVRLYLPESWTDDTKRMRAAGVPEAFRAHKSKGQLALTLLDRVREEGVRGGTVVADLGYGGASVGGGLTERGLHHVIDVPNDSLVFPRGRTKTALRAFSRLSQ